MKEEKKTKLFTLIFGLFLALGITPILLIAIGFALPYHLQFAQYKIVIGLLLIFSTISTLCLAGLVTRFLKHPLNQLLEAQKQVRHGHLEYRLPAHDNDELRKLFEGFNKMAEAIEKAAEQEQILAEQRSFNKLATQVVHDLRSPLSTLNILAHLLEENNLDPAHLKLLKLSCERLQTISEDLLRKRKDISTEKLSIHETMDHLILEFRAGSKYPNLKIEKNYEKKDILMDGEKRDFQRCFSNIMTNAIEAMHGDGSLTLTTSQTDHNILVEIKDTGPGMSPEILEKVLLGNFTYNKSNGNGIGMTVVQEVVEKYQGKLSASSQLGVGTTFQLSFPVRNIG